MKKNITKVIALSLTIAMLFTGFAFAGTLPTDIEKGSVLDSAVSSLMDEGAITGDTDGLFHPTSSLTRAQICKMLVTLIGPELTITPTQGVTSSMFSDLAGANWAAAYIEYAATNKIALGYQGKFRPSDNVSLNELATFVVRACGYTDSVIGGTWPSNYVAKAKALGLFANIDTTKSMAGNATKAEAAIMLYNAMDLIEKAEAAETEITLKSVVSGLNNANLTFVKSGKFDENVKTYNGKTLAKDAMVIAYGKKINYKEDMEFSTKTGDYAERTALLMKDISCPAFYALEDGQISYIIVPENAAFSGRVYCVVNDMSTFQNSDGTLVAFDTLTAMQEIEWDGAKSLDKSIIQTMENYDKGGVVFELYASQGQIKQVAVASDAAGFSASKAKVFKELTNGWTKVTDVKSEKGLIKLGDSWTGYNSYASIYRCVYESNTKFEYEVGSKSNIRKDVYVRLYDISDDDDDSADIIVIRVNSDN